VQVRRVPDIVLAGLLLLAVVAGFTALALRPTEGADARIAEYVTLHAGMPPDG
jgi:hypothetical protein